MQGAVGGVTATEGAIGFAGTWNAGNTGMGHRTGADAGWRCKADLQSGRALGQGKRESLWAEVGKVARKTRQATEGPSEGTGFCYDAD